MRNPVTALPAWEGIVGVDSLTIDPEHLISRGVPADLAEDSGYPWNPKIGQWKSTYDDWPSRFQDDKGRPPAFLYLFGLPDTGKSLIAAKIMRRAMSGGVTCRWLTVPHWLREEAMISAGKIEKTPFLEQVKRRPVGLTVLDDVGDHRADSAAQASTLAGLVNHQYSNRQQTIITSNLSIDELAILDPRLASRASCGVEANVEIHDSREGRGGRRYRYSPIRAGNRDGQGGGKF